MTKIIRRRSSLGAEMEEVAMIHEAEPRKILKSVVADRVPAIMSYSSKAKWHVAKVTAVDLREEALAVEISRGAKAHPINIQLSQPVGISLKYGYGKFIFDTKVLGFEPSKKHAGSGVILLELPAKIELVQRRSFFRVRVPQTMEVEVLLWHRQDADDCTNVVARNSLRGRLVDISAGGLQVTFNAGQKLHFKEGQFVGLKFTPLRHEEPLTFNAQIRNILPTADEKNVCFGLQIVGLETTLEGRITLQRLCDVVEQYYQISQLGTKSTMAALQPDGI